LQTNQYHHLTQTSRKASITRSIVDQHSAVINRVMLACRPIKDRTEAKQSRSREKGAGTSFYANNGLDINWW